MARNHADTAAKPTFLQTLMQRLIAARTETARRTIAVGLHIH